MPPRKKAATAANKAASDRAVRNMETEVYGDVRSASLIEPNLHRLLAVVNCVGPDGTLVVAGGPIPPEWVDQDPDAIRHLAASGGAVEES